MDGQTWDTARCPVEICLYAAAKAFEGIEKRSQELEGVLEADLAQDVANLLNVSLTVLAGHLTGPVAILQSMLNDAIDEHWDSERLEMELELLVERTAGDMRALITVKRSNQAAEKRAALTDDRLRELVLEELEAAMDDIRRNHPRIENKRRIKTLVAQTVKGRLQARDIVVKPRRVASVLQKGDFCPD